VWCGGTIFGADKVARLLIGIVPPFVRTGGVLAPHDVNGQPGAVVRDRDGRVVNTLALDVVGGRVQTIRAVVNPDKLGHVGPVGDAWAAFRDTRRARRPTE
jgi:RNA polymerase sigma-70 factor (ECF subfamily)